MEHKMILLGLSKFRCARQEKYTRIRDHGGFTLIEALVVAAIFALLAMLAYSSYSGSTTKARRTDAQAALMGFAQAMERHKTENGGYASAIAGAAPAAPLNYPDIWNCSQPA